MRPSLRSRHTLAVLSCGALVAGLAGLPAGPASASVAAQYGVVGSAQVASACTLTAGLANPSSTIASFSSGTQSRSVDLNATFTNTSDSTDTVSMIGHYSSSMTLAQQGGDLSKMLLTGQGSVRTIATKGAATACDPTADVQAVTELGFTESHAGWIYVTRNTVDKPGASLAVVENQTTGNAIALDVWQGGRSSAISRGFVTPGSFLSEDFVALTSGDIPPIILKTTPKSSLALAFHRAGSAFSGTSGSGAKFVRFPGSVSCSNGTAKLTWKSGAGKVASGSFFVNGKKKASVSNPKAGHHVVLRHLSKTADNKITANLKLNGGGHASAARLYVPCQG